MIIMVGFYNLFELVDLFGGDRGVGSGDGVGRAVGKG